jgi:CHAT domain-containing protein
VAAGEPLLEKFETVMLPSASALLELRAATVGRAEPAKHLAVFADPVFNAADPRVNPPLAAPARTENFQRLRFSRLEAQRIAPLSPTPAFQALDFEAGRKALESPSLAQYRVLHIASHALLNEREPELSGIVLSLVDQAGKPQNGYIQAREIYNLNLAADLVVLSACETAVGREIRGEGMLSLMRAFEYAGVPRVVASLWKVPDAPTAELMERFYTAMFRRKMTPAAALRSAQLEMWKSGKWRDPRSWAGFVLEGEFR